MVRAQRCKHRHDVGRATAMTLGDFTREALQARFEGRLRCVEERGGTSHAFHDSIVAGRCANIMTRRTEARPNRFANPRGMAEFERTIVHLIRHGDALPEEGAVFDGAAGYDNLGLSAKGARQANALGRRLASGAALVAIYTSPTRRAYETAAAVAAASDRTVVVDERLREVYLGDESLPAQLAPGARAAAIRARLADLAAIALRDGSWNAIAGAEPGERVAERMTAAVADIVRAHPGEHVALVSHAGAINAYFARLLGVANAFFFPAGNTSLSSVRIHNGRGLVLRLNDTAHLEAVTSGDGTLTVRPIGDIPEIRPDGHGTHAAEIDVGRRNFR